MLRLAWTHRRLNARSTVPSGADRSGVTQADLPDRGPDILNDLATLGPFFTVHAHLPGERPELPWLTVDDLASRSEPLRHRIASVRRALAVRAGIQADQIEARVAASLAHFGVVARLVSPTLAAMSLGYRFMTEPAELWWQDILGGPHPLSIAISPHGLERGQSAGTACGEFVSAVIEPVTVKVAELVLMSPRVLWGNVASAVNTAVLEISANRPAAADAAQRLAGAIFSTPQLQSERHRPGPGFRRDSCCLYHRLETGQARDICGDCVLISRRQPPPQGPSRTVDGDLDDG